MKYLAALVLSAMSLVGSFAVAAPVTITFDDPVNEVYTTGPDPLVGSFAIAERDGFVVSGIRFVDGFLGDPGDRGISSQTFELIGGPPQVFTVDLYRNDGQAFALLSAEGLVEGGITLIQAGGGSVFKSDFSDIGTADWLNLTGVSFSPASGGFSIAVVDNLTVRVVPIPPAIWLFGSALAGLYLRRRRN